ncbi:MAG: hypothetical protein Q8N68_03370 [bacterium]|nr:hypothetical protein [bacterium]
MSLETIKKKIKEAGQKEAEEILRSGKKEMSVLQEETAGKAKIITEKAGQELARERAQILEEARIRADFSRRNFLLSKKRELIDAVFKMALRNLAALDNEKKQRFLKQCLEKTKQELGSSVKIFASSADQEIIKKMLKHYSGFALSQKASSSVAGGFRAASEQIELDYTFDGLAAEKREALESEVAQILF